uniref:Uncharacterized protein n=1 Tax=Panagrolaimus sp. PS1159 TaxID=55785 RepID=A0AC35GM41_9BILA
MTPPRVKLYYQPGDEYDQGTVDGEDYTVQCCEENNCNTGKNGNGVETYSVFGSTFLLIFINVFMVFKNH